MDTLVTTVIQTYESAQSLKQTARECRISEQKVRKILISAGAWSSPTSDRVAELHSAGKSIDEIADELRITRNAVLGYMPYDRGMQDAEYPTINALRIRQCRAKKKNGGEK